MMNTEFLAISNLVKVVLATTLHTVVATRVMIQLSFESFQTTQPAWLDHPLEVMPKLHLLPALADDNI